MPIDAGSSLDENVFFVENLRRFVGKIRWTQKATGKYPQNNKNS